MGASYKGKHYKPHNEDRFVTTGDRNLTCDGVGGRQDGAAAAAAVSNQFLKAIEANPTLPDTEIAQLARQQLNQNPAISNDSSTCVVSTTISAPDITKNPELRTVEFKQWGDCNAVLFKRTIQTGAISIEGSTQDPGFTLLNKLMYGSRGAAPYKQYIKTRHQIDGSVGKSEITPPKTTVFSISLTPEVEYFVVNGSDGLFDNATPAHLTQLFLEVGKAGKSLPMAAMMQQIQYYHELRFEEAALLKIQSQMNNIATPAQPKTDTLTQIEIVQNTERIDIQTKLDILNQAEMNDTSIDIVCTQRLKEIQEKLAR